MTHDIIMCAPTVELLIDEYNVSSVMNDEESRASVSAVITRGQAARATPPQASEPGDAGHTADDVRGSGSPETGNTQLFINPDVIDEALNINESDGVALSAEQNADPTLQEALSLAARSKGGIASTIKYCFIRLFIVANQSAN
jgi:hypothetical protein